jgi:hypothetical protein
MKSSRPQWLQNVTNYFLDNVFDILTIAVATYIVIRHEFRPFGPSDIADLATWILAVLALIAVSSLWQHHRRLAAIESLSQETRDLVARRLSGRARSEDFFWSGDVKITAQDFAQARDISIVGMILNRTVRNHMAAFGDRLAAGANLRFVILDPENEGLMSIMPYRSYGSRPREWWQDRIRQTEGHIEDIPNSKDFSGTLKIGYLPYFPSFGMWLVDPDKPYGKIYIEIYHHRTPEMNPSFSLRATDDSYWYTFFRKQFDLLWESCENHGRIKDVDSCRLRDENRHFD